MHMDGFTSYRHIESRLGVHFHISDFFYITVAFFTYRDSYMFSFYIKRAIQKLDLFKHRPFLRFISNYMVYHLGSSMDSMGIKGVRFVVRGKISVTGVKRTRTNFFSFGFNSNASLSYKVSYNYTPVPTDSGVLGLQIWIF